MNAEKLYKQCSYEETKIVKSKKRILYLRALKNALAISE
jgi:hypothetical protein